MLIVAARADCRKTARVRSAINFMLEFLDFLVVVVDVAEN
jgi:hypothetical protein